MSYLGDLMRRSYELLNFLFFCLSWSQFKSFQIRCLHTISNCGWHVLWSWINQKVWSLTFRNDVSLYKAPYFKDWESFKIFEQALKDGSQGCSLFFIMQQIGRPLRVCQCLPEKVTRQRSVRLAQWLHSLAIATAPFSVGFWERLQFWCPEATVLSPRDTWQLSPLGQRNAPSIWRVPTVL